MKLNFALEPKEALKYLQNKGYLLSFFYNEVSKEQHHKAFTVAKIMRTDLLADVHEALLEAMREGKTFTEFKEQLRPTLKRKGWWGERDIVNPETGEVKTIHINASRLRNIFNTNLRVAMNVARHRQMSQLKTMTYWRYSAILDKHTRDDHAARHGIVLHRDDPWWKINYPPNGWGCRCKVRAYSQKQLERRGWKITKETPANIASKDWAYDIGDSSYVAEKTYFEKMYSNKCKKALSKKREILCPYGDVMKENYKKDMLQLLPSQTQWNNFIDESLDTNIKHHKSMRVGYLSMIEGLETFLAKQNIQSDLILANTGSIRNLRAKGEGSKKGKVLEVEEIKELITKIHKPDEIYVDASVILIWDFNSGKNKIVLEVDFLGKKEIYNKIYSGQKYEDLNGLKNMLSKAKKIK